MYKYAIIENNKVINTVLSEHEYALEQGWVVCPDEVGIEWNYVNGEFTDTRPVESLPLAPTKEQLMAELAVLTAKIQALE